MAISYEKDIRFCPYCGKTLERRFLEGSFRLFCPACKRIIYENPVPVVVAIAFNKKGEIVLVKRGTEPEKGKWALPAGFLEVGEAPDTGVLRELEEETGLKGKIVRLINVYSQESKRYGSILAIAYLIEVDGEPHPGDDAEDAKFFSPDNIPELPFESHRRALREAIGRK